MQATRETGERRMGQQRSREEGEKEEEKERGICVLSTKERDPDSIYPSFSIDIVLSRKRGNLCSVLPRRN